MKSLINTVILVLGMHTIAMAQTLPAYVPTTGIKCFHVFSGNANDVSGNSNNGAAVGATLTTGRFGDANNAYHLSGGSSSHISHSFSAFCPSGKFTIAAWGKSNTPVAAAPLIGARQGGAGSSSITCLGFDGAGAFFYVANGSLSQSIGYTASYMDNNWHYFCGTFDGSMLSLYVDNVLVKSQTFPVFTPPMTTNWKLGYEPYYMGPPRGFNGDIDEVGFWDGVLSQCQMSKLFLGSNSLVTTQPSNHTVVSTANAVFAVAGVTGATYQWQEDAGSGFTNIPSGGIYSGMTTNTLTVHGVPLTYNGYKYRCVVSYGGCTENSASALVIVNPNALPGLQIAADILLAPNPAQNTLNISSPVSISKIEVFDLMGQKVLSESAGNNKEMSVDISGLAKGVYFLKINEVYTKKLVKN